MVAKLKTPVISRFHILFVAIAFLATLILTIVQARQVSAAACPTPAADYGTVTQTLNVTSADTYRIWARIKVPDATNDYFHLEIDGNTCFNVGGGSSIPTNAWTWIPYADGQVLTPMTHTFATTGSHTIKLIGAKPDVQVDRLIFTSSTTCTPTGMGDDCMVAPPPSDTTNPVVNITAPANGATITSDTTPLSATASDNVGVTNVQFKVDGVNVGSPDTTSPYSVTLNTTTLTNGLHTVTATASDAAGNTATATSNFTLNRTLPDTTKPTVSVTSPTSGASVTANSMTLSANASDNTGGSGLVGVQFKIDGVNVGTEDTTAPYSISASTVALANGAHTVSARARDVAGNFQDATNINFTLNRPVATNPCDFNSDGTVNYIDLGFFADNYGKTSGFDQRTDFNSDGTVNYIDLGFFADRYDG